MKNVITGLNQFDQATLLEAEWLVTNGLGGFACGSVSGVPMRKYHSLLNASLPAPYGRTAMLNYVADSVVLPDGREILLSPLRFSKEDSVTSYLSEFRLENGIPIWRYQVEDLTIEKIVFLVYRQNTLHVSYRLLTQQENVLIKWRPFFHFRLSEQPVNVEIPDESYTVYAENLRYEIRCPGFPSLKIDTRAPLTIHYQQISGVFYQIEFNRGYESVGQFKSPGFFLMPLPQNEPKTFVASTESWETLQALNPAEALQTEKLRKRNLLRAAGPAGRLLTTAKLVLAADQFLITPSTRFVDMVRLLAMGRGVRTVIAGYPWFTDWGRDTMISLEGLTLATGRSREAYSILHTFAHYVQDGLIPNMFPDGEVKGIYNTADASLWFFHAIDRYIEHTGDEDVLEFLLPKLRQIIQRHVEGTSFGIKMDTDGLLMQGQSGVQLTWMDAKVGDWVVTPRRGKAVEINGLWYNALRLFERWADKSNELSERCRESFNQKFWIEADHYLYDVIEGENGTDSSLRPNQLFAISLTYPVLNEDRWAAVFQAVTEQLLSPFGLRTLSPSHPDYKAKYDGDLRARDAAYHQGTVWPWLLGAYIDVRLKLFPHDREGACQILKGLIEHLNSNCMGTLGEIFDAVEPYHARGCFAQAWSVAELLRCLVKLLPQLKIQAGEI